MAFAFSVGMGVPICTRCAKLLLAAGARVDDAGVGLDGEPAKENTPLYIAFTHGHCNLVKVFLRAGAQDIAVADFGEREPGNEAAFELRDAIRAAGGWAEFVAKHRRVLSGLVSKLSAKKSRKGPPPVRQSYYHVPAPRAAGRPIPLDAASHVVAFWCPPGGH
ncbi:hypothetical protein SO694_00037272 [Aureococcus anophagefferens]|uniref:Uncharacterized protein n=1 Tax=Aureococcus anophagefferens TaxID=44056 RepID=A0ABR1FL44_AURAN|nr:hypothetical protein JL720_7400 [Aureococcus anophagefferens]